MQFTAGAVYDLVPCYMKTISVATGQAYRCSH